MTECPYCEAQITHAVCVTEIWKDPLTGVELTPGRMEQIERMAATLEAERGLAPRDRFEQGA